MRGARSHLGGGTAPSVCLAGRKMEWRYKPAKTLFTLHPFPCWISLLPLSKPDRPETLETTVSSRCVPFLVFSEGLEGLLEMWNKLVCPWRVTLRGILPFFNYYGTPFYLQEALFKGGGSEWLSRYSPGVIIELSQTDLPIFSLKHNHSCWEATNTSIESKPQKTALAGQEILYIQYMNHHENKWLQMVFSQQHSLEKVWYFVFPLLFQSGAYPLGENDGNDMRWINTLSELPRKGGLK